MVELFANSGDTDQMPRSVASDLGLHCLPVTSLGISICQWVKEKYLCQIKIVLNMSRKNHNYKTLPPNDSRYIIICKRKYFLCFINNRVETLNWFALSEIICIICTEMRVQVGFVIQEYASRGEQPVKSYLTNHEDTY